MGEVIFLEILDSKREYSENITKITKNEALYYYGSSKSTFFDRF